MTTLPDNLLTVSEVARLVRVSAITVRRHIAAGRLEAVRVGRAVRVSKEALGRFIKPAGRKRRVRAEGRAPAGRPLTQGDPLFKLLGMAGSAPASDSSKKHEYLAEAIAHHRQGDGNS